jgi:hypothetical protein
MSWFKKKPKKPEKPPEPGTLKYCSRYKIMNPKDIYRLSLERQIMKRKEKLSRRKLKEKTEE